MTYSKDRTGLVVIDPYNDFISEGGKVWDRLRGVAEANKCVPHMSQVLDAARSAGIRVFYALHHRYRTGDYEDWQYIAPIQKAAWSHKRSNTERGVGRSVRSSNPNREMSSRKSIGVPVVSRTRIWIFSKGTALIS